jgi:glycosyltransferase involved in cell wall biosynthesis
MTPMVKRNLISVVVPAYNSAGLIGQTLRSLLNQTLPADEIIVVDDGSTDSTAKVAESEFSVFSRQFSGKGKLPEFKVVRQENAGPGAARNHGFAASTGEFIHFFDSDDLAAPNKHEVQVRALQESGADIAYGPWVKGYIKEHGAWSMEQGAQSGSHAEKRYSFEPEGHVLQQKGLPKGDLIKELLTRWSVVPHACMFRRSIVEKIGGFPNELFGTEDQMMFLRCLLAGARVIHTPQTIEFYRLGEAGKITATGVAQQRHAKEWAKFLASVPKECEVIGGEPLKWAGFRRRIWAARGDLVFFGGPGSEAAMAELPRVSALDGAFYFLCSKAGRMWRGIKARVGASRQNASFRCGRLTRKQVELFQSLS